MVAGGWEIQMERLGRAVALALLAVPACAQQKAPPVPDLLKRALTTPAPKSKQLYAYDFEDVMEGGTKKEQATSTVRGHVDPSREKGDRVTITFAQNTGDRLTDLTRIDERYERNADGPTFCDTLSKEDVTNVVDKGAVEGGRAFSFTPKAEGDADGQIKDLMKKMAGEAVVDEASATLRSFSATLTRPHSFMLVAEVKTANIRAQCVQAPDGRAYAARTEFDIVGSGFGQSFASKSFQTVSNVTPAG